VIRDQLVLVDLRLYHPPHRIVVFHEQVQIEPEGVGQQFERGPLTPEIGVAVGLADHGDDEVEDVLRVDLREIEVEQELLHLGQVHPAQVHPGQEDGILRQHVDVHVLDELGGAGRIDPLPGLRRGVGVNRLVPGDDHLHGGAEIFDHDDVVPGDRRVHDNVIGRAPDFHLAGQQIEVPQALDDHRQHVQDLVAGDEDVALLVLKFVRDDELPPADLHERQVLAGGILHVKALAQEKDRRGLVHQAQVVAIGVQG